MTQVTFHDIVAGLEAIGLREGMNLLVHSSLRSFGYVQGGPDTVIDAILHVLGDSGTLVVPTLSFRSIDEGAPFFHAKNTPSDCGIITEILRQRPGALRSLHPVSSVAALGPNAGFLTESHKDTPCDLNSPYGRLLSLNGYSLFLGVGFGSNSMFHVAEEMVAPQYLSYKAIEDAHIIDLEGREYVATFRRYNCSQSGVIRHLVKMGQVFEERGVLSLEKIGNSTCTLISARDNVEISCEVLRRDPGFILDKSQLGMN